ncbi:MAG: tRNA (adenosine(37)-N6)-threonylcarbamoyltransferase complex transferase subunit TsaD, partial [Flavobacteriales bacterium]
SKINKEDISAVAYTYGPGLVGALMVGTSFAKGFANSLDLPLLPVHHMRAHVLAHFIPKNETEPPELPFLCLTVSGGHTQIVHIKEGMKMDIIGETIDDAAGEAFDKTAKLLGLPYPGGPLIDKYAKKGNPIRFEFPIAKTKGYNFSFSGLKTAILYFIREAVNKEKNFIEKNIHDICASVQKTIIQSLLIKLEKAVNDNKLNSIALAGGVSANSALREETKKLGKKLNCDVHIPPFEFCTDNAAMIAMAGYLDFKKGDYDKTGKSPQARAEF